jgi:YrbI family 3-deoxy-D-manno-octulosonate 8-phosphate phosphatase
LANLAVNEVFVNPKKIKAFFTDVDGCLTDARVYMGEREELVAFSIQDGIGQRLLEAAGIPVLWLSGRSSLAVARRAKKLGVRCLYLGHLEKLKTAGKVCRSRGWKISEIAFMGDDLIDLPLLRKAGWAVAPANARPEVKRAAHFVTKAHGGHGAFREAVEKLLKARGLWARTVDAYLKKALQ